MSIVALEDIKLYSKINELGCIREKMSQCGDLSVEEIKNLDSLYEHRVSDIKDIMNERKAITNQYEDIQPKADVSEIINMSKKMCKPLKGECINIDTFGYSIDEANPSKFIYKEYMTVLGSEESEVRPILKGDVVDVKDTSVTIKIGDELFVEYNDIMPIDVGVGSIVIPDDTIGKLEKDEVTSDFKLKLKVKYKGSYINPSLLLG